MSAESSPGAVLVLGTGRLADVGPREADLCCPTLSSLTPGGAVAVLASARRAGPLAITGVARRGAQGRSVLGGTGAGDAPRAVAIGVGQAQILFRTPPSMHTDGDSGPLAIRAVVADRRRRIAGAFGRGRAVPLAVRDGSPAKAQGRGRQNAGVRRAAIGRGVAGGRAAAAGGHNCRLAAVAPV